MKPNFQSWNRMLDSIPKHRNPIWAVSIVNKLRILETLCPHSTWLPYRNYRQVQEQSARLVFTKRSSWPLLQVSEPRDIRPIWLSWLKETMATARNRIRFWSLKRAYRVETKEERNMQATVHSDFKPPSTLIQYEFGYHTRPLARGYLYWSSTTCCRSKFYFVDNSNVPLDSRASRTILNFFAGRHSCNEQIIIPLVSTRLSSLAESALLKLGPSPVVHWVLNMCHKICYRFMIFGGDKSFPTR